MKYRPVFPAAAPGAKISPEFAGRLAADFALGAQLSAATRRQHAEHLRYGGSGAHRAFAQRQLDFALGANAWGSSFTVGAGDTYPHCMQSEIANLAGSLTGHGNIQVGATSDGPGNLSNFEGLGTVDGMRACRAGHFKPFNTKTTSYQDNVVSWRTVEPATDYTANSTLAFALAAAAH